MSAETTAYWPTDKLYSVATKQLPEDMETKLRERLVGNEMNRILGAMQDAEV